MPIPYINNFNDYRVWQVMRALQKALRLIGDQAFEAFFTPQSAPPDRYDPIDLKRPDGSG